MKEWTVMSGIIQAFAACPCWKMLNRVKREMNCFFFFWRLHIITRTQIFVIRKRLLQCAMHLDFIMMLFYLFIYCISTYTEDSAWIQDKLLRK